MEQGILNGKNNKLSVVPWFFLALFFLILSAVIAFAILPRSLAAGVTMEVYQQQGRKAFGQTTSLDIFNDPDLGGQKLVHPFSEGSYTFAVYNNSDSDPLPYTIAITETNPHDIPLVFSLQKNDVYVYGNAGVGNRVPFSGIDFPETLLDG